jgi:cytochrome c551
MGEKVMKKKLLGFMLGTSLVFGLAACGGGQDEGTTSDGTTETTSVGDAQKIYNQKCSSCHGGNLEGGFGPALEKIGAKLSKDEILNVINNGKGSMPPGIINDDEAEAVAEWLANNK